MAQISSKSGVASGEIEKIEQCKSIVDQWGLPKEYIKHVIPSEELFVCGGLEYLHMEDIHAVEWDGAVYALKSIPINISESEWRALLMLPELVHKNIVTFIGYTVLQQHEKSSAGENRFMKLAILMEKLETDLSQFLEEERRKSWPFYNSILSERLQWDIMKGIAEGMAYLHGKGIGHGGVVPHHLMVSTGNMDDVIVKLIDFGCPASYCHTSYAAPEVLVARVGPRHGRSLEELQVDYEKADVYSFGITCSEIILASRDTDDRYKTSAPSMGFKQGVINGTLRPVLPTNTRPDLKELLERCWDGEPASRPDFSEICHFLSKPMIELPKQEGGRRPWSGSKYIYNFLVMFFILLEPLSNTVGFLTNNGCFVFGLLLQWVRIHTGTSGQQVSSPYKSRVKSKDLTLGSFLGQGCTGLLYETAWSRSQENTGRLARKLFPGVTGDVFESEVVRLFELTDHPNIVKIFCWTVDSKSCSLIMEFVSDNLSNIVRKKTEARRKEDVSKQIVIGTTRSAPFKFPEAIQLLVQIAKGIRHLHAQDIYHGDLKPNNVLIDGEIDPMLVKLADFGLVKTKRRTTLVSQRTLCSHMIAWRAPEIVEDYISSMSDDLDYLGVELDIQDASSVLHDKVRTKISMEKADTYSFALLCAYVLGGKVWDANLSSNELRKQTSRFGLRPKLPSECPEALASLISLCWDADPKRRPTFSIICDKLEKIVKDHQREKKGKYPPEQPEETVRQRARPVGGKFDA